MADAFPSQYVDPKTGEVTTLGTAWDRVESEGLLKGADYALTLGKMAILAPVIGVAALVAPAAIWLVSKAKFSGMFNRVYDRSLDETKSHGEQYDMTTSAGVNKFNTHFGDVQPAFADDYVRMCKMAGLPTVPRIIVRDDPFDGWGMFGRHKDYNAGAASRTDGSRPSIEIGDGVLEQMTPGELRAIIGHEITHLALGHTKDRASWLARGPINLVLNVALIGAAVLGAVPFLPAVALAGVCFLAQGCLESINSRRREEQCDRGAAILCGGTKDLADGLKKLKALDRKDLEQQITQMKRMSILFGRGKGRDAEIRIKEESWWHRFLKASHPTNERREKLLNGFEEKYHGYCEQQRSKFKQAFNIVARKPQRQRDPSLDLADIFGGAHRGRGPVIILHGPRGKAQRYAA